MRFRLISIFIAIAVIASLVQGFMNANKNIQKVESSAAARFVAEICIQHMKTNQGAWPTSWEELKDDYATCKARSLETFTFDELKQRVGLNHDADITQNHLLELDEGSPTETYIWSIDGKTTHGPGKDPNVIIHDYLKSLQNNN